MPDPATRVVLGIDFGARRIGLATGNTLTGTARPLNTVRHDGRNQDNPLDAIDRVIQEWKPERLIVGLPLAADGSETDMSRAARCFARALRARHPDIAIDFQDERYSSRTADTDFAQARRDGRARRRDARNLDSAAAAVIVESWLAARQSSRPA